MTNRTMALALQMTADFGQASKASVAVEKDIANIGKAADKANDSLQKIDTSKLGEAADASERAAKGVADVGKAADDGAERYRRIAQEAIAYRAALDAQVAATQATSVADREAALAAEQRNAEVLKANQAALASQQGITEQMRSIGELNQRLEAGAATRKDLADTEQLLDRARHAGMLTDEEHTAALATLDKQEKQLIATQAKEEQQMRALLRAYDPAHAALAKLASDEARLKDAVDKGRISREQYNRAMVGVSSSRAQWQQYADGVDVADKKVRNLSLSAKELRTSLASAATQLAQGNISGAGNALTSIGSRGALSFGALGVAIVGVVAVLGLFAAAVYKGEQQQMQFERALISSGNIIGTTAGELANVRNEAGEASGKFEDAQTSITALAVSGKVATDVLDSAASAALNLAELTGDSIESTTQKIIALADAPSQQLAELNEQYHFLTLEVYDHVKSLEEQGRAEDAARAAIEAFAEVHEQRVQEARERAGTLEKAWHAVKSTILGAWQAMKDLGREDAAYRLQQAKDDLASTQANFGSVARGLQSPADREAELAAKQKLVQQLEAQVVAEKGVAKAKAEGQTIEDQAIAARAAIDKRLEAGLDKRSKKQKALNELIQQYNVISAADPNDRRLYDGSYEKQVAAINEQFKEPKGPKAPKPKKTEAQKAEESGQRELDNLRQQTALLGELEEGEKKASEAARIRYAIESGAFKSASSTLQQQLLAAATELDTERKRVEVAKELVDVKLRTMQLQGRSDEGQLAETTKELERLRVKLIELGKLGEAADVAKLMKLEAAKVELGALQRDLDTFFSRVATAETKINIDRENGLISGVEAQRRLLDIRKQEIGYLEQQIPLLERQNDLLQDPRVAESLEQMKLRLYELQQQGTLLETTFRNTFEQGLADALTGLATGTMTLKDALTGLIRDVVSGMARLAAQQLASIATAKLMSVLFKESGTADVSAGASKLQTAAIATGLAGGVIKFGAEALSNSAKELAAAATLMLVANSMGGFAEGGYTGAGGKYQVAGYVHRGEYVMPQSSVNKYGIDFMRSIHAGTAPRYALAAPSSVPSPRYSFAEGGFAEGLAGLTPEVNLRNINLFDVNEAIRQHFAGPQGDKTYLNMVGRNSRASRLGR